MCTVYCQLRRNYSVYCDIDVVQVQKHNHNNAFVLFTVHCVLPTVCFDIDFARVQKHKHGNAVCSNTHTYACINIRLH